MPRIPEGICDTVVVVAVLLKLLVFQTDFTELNWHKIYQFIYFLWGNHLNVKSFYDNL